MDALTVRLITIPLISAFTGYITNYIAVRMLFRPRRRLRILGMPLQGLIPKRRSDLAHSIGETVEQHLISHEDIRAALGDPELIGHVERMIDGRVGDVLEKRLGDVHPMARVFLTEKLIAKIHRMLMDEIRQAIGPMTEEIATELENRINFRQIVVRKIEEFDLDRLEQIILSISSRELKAIEVLGGVLGFIIGLVTDLLLLIG